jgi:signal transduction histidine kinase
VPLRFGWALVAVVTSSCPESRRGPAQPPVTRVHDVGASVGPAGQDIDLRGIVTFFDADRHTLYLHDATGDLAFDVGDLGASVIAGERVQLEGRLRGDGTPPRLDHPRLTVLGQSGPDRMPAPRRVDVPALLAHEANAQWVEVHGVVRSMIYRGRAFRLELQESGRRFQAEILSPDPGYPSLVDNRIRLRGVSAPAALLVPDIGLMRIEDEPPEEPFLIPQSSAAELRRAPAETLPDHWVHVRGSVVGVVDERRFVLAADGHECEVIAQGPAVVRIGDAVDVLGFPALSEGRLSFEEALVRSTALVARIAPTPPALPVLTTAIAVRQLSAADADKAYPIRLRGIVTYNNPETQLLFVQDGTAGIYVEAWRHIHHVEPGDLVEVEGRSAKGAFAPIVNGPRVRLLSHGSLPEPRRIQSDDLVTGDEDSQWVEIEGVVRSATVDERGASIRLAAGSVQLLVTVLGAVDGDLARTLVNAHVRVRGVCSSVLTARGQLADIRIESPSLSCLKVVTAPAGDPFALPAKPIGTLLQYVSGQNWAHRIRVKGIVTYSRLASLYLKDDTGGLYVHTDGRQRLSVGEEVDLVGFASLGDYSPALQDAQIRSLGTRDAPQAQAVTPEQALGGGHDGELVRIEARLLDTVSVHDEQQLSMQAGPYLFTAVLGGAPPLSLPTSSVLELTGICVVNPGEARIPQSFQILLRGPADVRLLRAAPWWTLPRIAWTAAVACALAWVVILRRRVRAQSRIIWARVKRETELQERQRMARELHDTLEQNLTGISLSLGAASLLLSDIPTMAHQHLSRALEQVKASIESVHRSVWALREDALSSRGLQAALGEIGQQLASCSPVPLDVRTSVVGQPRPFSLAVENDLLRIGQEAITNSVKHGHAAHLTVELRYEDEAFTLLARDDGRGFDTSQMAGPGHFGLIGMRERAREIGAVLEVRSAPSRGTEVRVTLPLQPFPLRQTS